MIISQLTGGLGNQMFQYAFGYSLARKNDVVLLYCYQHIDGNTKRELELKQFNISGVEADRSDLIKLGYYSSFIDLVLDKIGFTTSSTLKEKNYYFDKNAQEMSGNFIVQGYWQSYKYFLSVSDEIRNEFTFKKILSGQNAIIIKQIVSQNSVSVHIRRGDYISNKKTHDYHGICDLDYYQSAIEKITKEISSPVFYFFSDDPEWVKKNLKTKTESYYINWNTGENSFRDMQLMSLCKHNIIANSSFSWWGAWLNTNPKKIVIAPRKWFNDTSINTSDLIPDSWIKI